MHRGHGCIYVIAHDGAAQRFSVDAETAFLVTDVYRRPSARSGERENPRDLVVVVISEANPARVRARAQYRMQRARARVTIYRCNFEMVNATANTTGGYASCALH